MSTLTTKKRKALPTSAFGLPGSRKFPMPDRSHAVNAEARATQMVDRGLLSPTTALSIKRKAKRVLGK